MSYNDAYKKGYIGQLFGVSVVKSHVFIRPRPEWSIEQLSSQEEYVQ